VLALHDKLAFGPTFEAALASLYGGEASSLRAAEAPQPTPASQAQPSDDLHSLIAEAGKDLTDYQRLTAEGKLGEAGQKLEELKRVIDQLNARQKLAYFDCLFGSKMGANLK
jgi:hypothetical protein